jgi:hypothetical protein
LVLREVIVMAVDTARGNKMRSAVTVLGVVIGITSTAFMISVIPRDGVSQAEALADVQRVKRSRHGLKRDQPDDFDLVTQDAFLKLWDQISQGTFFALVVISSIALMSAASA